MKRICIGIVFMACALAGIAQGKIKNFDEFYNPQCMVRHEGILSVYCQEEKLYLEIPGKLLSREMLLTAQVNRGAMMLGRPLSALGVFHFILGEEGKLYLRQGKYTERIVDRRNPLSKVLENSNYQPVHETFDIIAINPENQGYIIDITKALKTGKSWMDVKLENLRGVGSDLVLKQVEATGDGMAFTFIKSCFYSYPLEAAGIKRQEGKISVEVGCMLRLLPERSLPVKSAGDCPGYEVVRFIEYGKNPYGTSQDSIIQRWRLEIPRREQVAYRKGSKVNPVEPIVFYIDADCPKIWCPWIKKAVLDWNQAFEDAGFKDVLQVRMAKKSENTVKHRALISYDLASPLLSSEKTVHPETGEILFCRVNIGHGVWGNQRERYLLQCGAVDQRIVNDFDDVEVAGEILCSMVTREIGHMLGLKYNVSVDMPYSIDRIRSGECPYTVSVMNENAYNYVVQPGDRVNTKNLVPGVGEYDRLMIADGYGEGSRREDLWREKLKNAREKDVKENIRAMECGIRNLKAVYKQLEKRLYRGKDIKDHRLKDIHQIGKELYKGYLSEVAEGIGEGGGQEAVRFLEDHLFAPNVSLPSFAALEEAVENEKMAYCKAILLKMCSPRLAKQLLQKESGYTLNELYADIHRIVFADFKVEADLSAFDLNMRNYYMKTLLESAVKENASDCSSDYQSSLYVELQKLRDHFQRLAEETPETLVGRFYKFWQKKIEKQITF